MHNTAQPESMPADRFATRLASVKDAAAISHLGTVTFTNSFGYSMPAEDLKAYLENSYSEATIESELAEPRFTWLVVCDQVTNAVIGYAQLSTGTFEPCVEGSVEPLIEFQRMYMDANYHGSGAAKILFEAAERVARDRGVKTIWLGVWEENLRAHRFYEKMGYRKVGTHDFVMGTCIQTDWVLKKEF